MPDGVRCRAPVVLTETLEMELLEIFFWAALALVALIPILDARRDPSWRKQPVRVRRRR